MHEVTRLYYQAALGLSFPAVHVKEIYGFKIELGKKVYFFRGGITPFNNDSSIDIAGDKFCANKILEKAGLPVPKAIMVSKQEFKENNWSLEGVKFPLVVKPTMLTGCGKDVLCNIQDMESLISYMDKGFKKYDLLSVEEFHDDLKDYRVLIFFNKVIGVVERISARVTGDGKHNISELIEAENINRKEFKDRIPLGDIKVDEEYRIRLKELGITLDYIPSRGEVVKLCYNCNSTRGGTMISLGDKICAENANLFCEAARVLGLNIAGFDLRCRDINMPMEKSGGVIIEANDSPETAIHESALNGETVGVSKIIMKRLIRMHPFRYGCILLKNKLKKIFIPEGIYLK